MRLLCVLVVVAAVVHIAAARKPTPALFNNAVPRRDTNGHITDVHDGSVVYYNGTYYQYGAAYGGCLEPVGENGCADFGLGNCGFQVNHTVRVYTSTDLNEWTSHPPVFSTPASIINGSIVYSPKVVYNRQTKTFVMWLNYLKGSFNDALYGVATSANPFGPFEIVNQKVDMPMMNGVGVGDVGLFVDDDDKAYAIYTGNISSAPSHLISIVPLSSNYTTLAPNADKAAYVFSENFCEAPALFRDPGNKLYYALFGHCCCFCGVGSNIIAHVATNPLGPYTRQGFISPSVVQQLTYVFYAKLADGTQQAIMVGDRWQSSPDRIKGHDYLMYTPLSISLNGTVQQAAYHQNFTLLV